MEQAGQLAWLITKRSWVQIPSPLLINFNHIKTKTDMVINNSEEVAEKVITYKEKLEDAGFEGELLHDLTIEYQRKLLESAH